MSIRHAVILVGGRGARLGKPTGITPRPMLDVGGRPFIEHVIAQVGRFGCTEALLLAGYRGDTFTEAYHRKSMFGVRITVVVEPEPSGTAGALRFAAARLPPVFLMVDGDTYFDADYAPLLRLAERPDCSIALLLRCVDDPGCHAPVLLDRNGRVLGFAERGQGNPNVPALVDAGTYLINRDAMLASVPPGPCSFERDVLPRAVVGGKVRALQAQGYFVDIRVPSSLRAARAELLAARRRPVAFLDRDGVINVDDGYTHRLEDLRFMKDASAAIALLNAVGYYAIVVSNQSGIARGYYDEEQARLFNEHMRAQLLAQGARIDAMYFCPHHPEGKLPKYKCTCSCRKPGTGLLQLAAKEWPLDLSSSFLVGDKSTDMSAAAAFGIPGYLHDGGSLLATVRRALAGRERTMP